MTTREEAKATIAFQKACYHTRVGVQQASESIDPHLVCLNCGVYVVLSIHVGRCTAIREEAN